MVACGEGGGERVNGVGDRRGAEMHCATEMERWREGREGMGGETREDERRRWDRGWASGEV